MLPYLKSWRKRRDYRHGHDQRLVLSGLRCYAAKVLNQNSIGLNMATLQIENLPDELYHCVQSFADDRKLTVNETIIFLLKQAFELSQPQVNQPKSMAKVLQGIRDRPRLNPINFGLPDSTTLIREDRN